jgi:hypothetical protein
VKVAAGITRTHNPFDEDYWASCLRENLTSSSYGEGLETGREFAQEPRQSFTRLTPLINKKSPSMICMLQLANIYPDIFGYKKAFSC